MSDASGKLVAPSALTPPPPTTIIGAPAILVSFSLFGLLRFRFRTGLRLPPPLLGEAGGDGSPGRYGGITIVSVSLSVGSLDVSGMVVSEMKEGKFHNIKISLVDLRWVPESVQTL